MAIVRQGLTLEQFLALPEKKPALEYEDGVVTQKVAPKLGHGALQFQVSTLFNRYTLPRKLALAVPELRTTFAGRSRVPDVAVVRWDRLLRLPDGRLADEPLGEPPLIAVEIRSPEQRRNALVTRCTWYASNGVALSLLVDSHDQSITAFPDGEPPRVLHGRDETDFGALLPGLRFVVDDVFEALRVD